MTWAARRRRAAKTSGFVHGRAASSSVQTLDKKNASRKTSFAVGLVAKPPVFSGILQLQRGV